MQKPTWKVSAVVLAAGALCFASVGLANDAFPPCWRVTPGTTYQNWAFPNNSNPANPDTFTNPNGTPQATMTVGPFGVDWQATLFGRSGVWDLGPNGSMSLAIPNFGGSSNMWKYVNVQVTYFDDGAFVVAPTISIAGGTFVSSQVATHESPGIGFWRTLQSVWLIKPTPTSETVLLSASPTQGLTIDQVIIDTRCPTAGDGDVAAYRPCWRGQPGSTFQQWMFGVSNNPASIPAELITNAFGAPHASIAFGASSDHYIAESAFLGCRQGIWDLGHSGSMTLVVSNTPSGSSGSYKYVRVQVTQYRDSIYTADATVSIAGGTLVSQNETTLLTVAAGRTWVVQQTIWRMGPPCPVSESVVITAPVAGTLVDQVVIDTLCLDFACPSDVAGIADAGLCSKANVTWTLPTPNGCTVASVSSSPANGSTFAVGTTPVHSIITDGEGGTKTCDFNVIVTDTQPPTITCPANMTVPKDPAQCGALVTFSPTPSDNCPGSTVTSVPASGSLFPVGITTVTSTAHDAHGLDSTPCTFTVRVIDFSGDYSGYVPCWRGQPNTTFQQWAFSVSNNPASLSPELVTNPYGAPSASISFGASSDHYINSSVFLGCAQGIWDLGHSGSMTLAVPNTPGSGTSYKYVRVQVTQYRDTIIYTANAAVSIVGATVVSEQQQTIQTVAPGRTWVVDQTILRLAPSPASESVVITAPVSGSLIDQVVVDTLSLDFTCPSPISANADPGQCSKANVTWTLPTVNGCTVISTSSSPASGSTFAVGTTPVHSVITDGEGGTKTCDFNVVILDNQPPVITNTVATEVQPFAGTVDVQNCANPTVQGTVNIVVHAGDQCPLNPPIVGLTNGLSGTTAVFVNQSPAGTFNYTWTVTSGTANGTWTAKVTASDTANSVSSSFTMCVDNSQITGQVQLENFLGTGTSPLHTRTVTFRATDATGAGATVLKTWSLLLANVSGSTFNYTLTQVPAGTVAVSAKTAWNLRKKQPVTLLGGQGTADFTGVNKLLGGDVSGNPNSDVNSVNAADKTVVDADFLQPMPGAAPADINGTGTVNAADLNFINDNWFKTGDPK